MKTPVLLYFLLFQVPFLITAQFNVSGRVLDEKTKEPVPFVHIATENNPLAGATTDIDGLFEITIKDLPEKLTFLSVGYISKELLVTKETTLDVYLTQEKGELKEVVVLPGENPAHKYILRAIEKKSENDPLNREQFQCKLYSKLYYTLAPELYAKIQSDTSKKSTARLIDNYHLFLIENVIERSYKKPDKLHDYVIANRMSGLKNPMFALPGADLQPFSFYQEELELLTKLYLNPLSKKGFKKYFYNIEDTLIYAPLDTTFIISYRPSKGNNFNALKGVLSINTKNFAIENVTAEPFNEEMNSIKLHQQYTYLDGSGWFPKQLYTEIHFSEQEIVLVSKTYVTNVDFIDSMAWGHKNIALELDPQASNNADYLLRQNRGDSLTVKDKKTYAYIDSVGESIKLDERIKKYISLIDGRLSLGPFDVVLNRLMEFNLYEKFRLGAGLMTNDKLIKNVSFGGYWAYGFGDKKQKYGALTEVTLNKASTSKLSLSYIDDVVEPGRDDRFLEQDYKSRVATRDYLASQMDKVKQYKAELKFRMLQKVEANISVRRFHKTFQNEYLFLSQKNEDIELLNAFKALETSISLRYASKEKLVESFGRMLPYTDGGVLINVIYSRGHRWYNHDFNYNRILASVKLPLNLHFLGKADIVLQGGYVDDHIPASEMFFASGTKSKQIPYLVDYTFQTMILYEYISSSYAAAFLNHSLGTIYTGNEKIRPSFFLNHAVMVGTLNELNRHINLHSKKLRMPYLESGFVIKDIFRKEYFGLGYVGFGGGVFYRYGGNALPIVRENITLKFAASFSI